MTGSTTWLPTLGALAARRSSKRHKSTCTRAGSEPVGLHPNCAVRANPVRPVDTGVGRQTGPGSYGLGQVRVDLVLKHRLRMRGCAAALRRTHVGSDDR